MDLDDEELKATRKLNRVDKEIAVGEYVRLSRNQGINKIIEIEDDKYILENEIADEYGNATCVLEKDMYEEEILKHSKNIIDLIEVGDVIELNNEVYQVIYDESYKKLGVLIPNKKELAIRHSSLEFIFSKQGKQKFNEISIVTKEQFKNAEYRV